MAEERTKSLKMIPADTVPVFDMALHFSAPSVIAAGLVFNKDSIDMYTTLDGRMRAARAECSTFLTPNEALFRLLDGFGIEMGREEDGDGKKGKIVDLTQPSYAVSMYEVAPDMRVRNNAVLFDFSHIITLAWKHYPNNEWIL